MRLNLYIPDVQFESLEAIASPKTVEQLIVDRLPVLLEFDPTQPHVVLGPKELGEITALLNGTLIRSAAQLVKELKRTQTLHLDGIEVSLDTDTLLMLFSQAEGMGIEPMEYIRQSVKTGLEFTVGGAAQIPHLTLDGVGR